MPTEAYEFHFANGTACVFLYVGEEKAELRGPIEAVSAITRRLAGSREREVNAIHHDVVDYYHLTF